LNINFGFLCLQINIQAVSVEVDEDFDLLLLYLVRLGLIKKKNILQIEKWKSLSFLLEKNVTHSPIRKKLGLDKEIPWKNCLV
jgi:hypothetical protein